MCDTPPFTPAERDLLGALLDEHWSRLNTFLREWIRNDHAREDFIGDVIVLVLRMWSKYDHERPFWPWYRTVAVNYLRTQARSKRWRPMLSNIENMDSLLDIEAFDDRWVTAADIGQRVLHLPDALRETVTLRYWQEKTCQEIADLLDIKIGTVWSRLYDAHQRLRRTIDGSSVF